MHVSASFLAGWLFVRIFVTVDLIRPNKRFVIDCTKLILYIYVFLVELHFPPGVIQCDPTF
jgi:hypothetical protein